MELTENLPQTVCFFPADHFGCGFYRCMLPSIALCRLGIPAHIITIDRINLYSIANVLVVQRPADASMVNLIEEAKKNGVKTILEIDDNIWDIPVWNQSYPFWTPIRASFCTNVAKICDRIVTTTTTLQKVLQEFNDDVVVVPNAIYDSQKTTIIPHADLRIDSKIVLGWIGSSFHAKDTKIFISLIPLILEKYKDVLFIMMGEGPPRELAGYSNRILSLPFVEPIYYHQVISSFHIDIGLAPLVTCNFNKSKSPVKVIEYLYTKTFPICSDIDPYANIKKEFDDACLLVPTNENLAGTVDDWMDRIDYCITNIDKVREKAIAGNKFVLDNYSIECDRMIDIYKKAYFLDN